MTIFFFARALFQLRYTLTTIFSNEHDQLRFSVHSVQQWLESHNYGRLLAHNHLYIKVDEKNEQITASQNRNGTEIPEESWAK
jgi:hypothetical protein